MGSRSGYTPITTPRSAKGLNLKAISSGDVSAVTDKDDGSMSDSAVSATEGGGRKSRRSSLG